MNYKPLKWNIDWENMTFKERFLLGAPFIATEDKAYKDIAAQLKERDDSYLSEWDKYSPDIKKLAIDLLNRIKNENIWPSAIFLPDDPADIPLGVHFDFTDKLDFYPIAYSIVEKDLKIKMDTDFWNGLHKMTFGQAIEKLYKKKAELSASGNPASPSARA